MKKYLILAASILLMLFIGSNYAWSTFVPVLKSKYGLTIAQSQTIFGTVIFIFGLFTIIGGRLQDRIGPRIPALTGGLIFGASYILAGYSSGRYLELQTFIGITSGIGAGLCYLCPVVCAVKWFPERKSIVTGIVVAAYPVSAIIVSRISEYLLAQQIDVLVIFRYMGFFSIIVVTLTSLILHNPAPAGTGSIENADIKTILKSRNFWGLICAIYSASCIGLMIVGNVKPLGIQLNLDTFVAGAAVSIVSFSNALGRLAWGVIGNMMEGKTVIICSLISSVIVCVSAPLLIRDALSFKIFSIMAGLNFASCNVLYAAEVAHTYGPNRMGTIYSILLLGNGIAGLTAPPLAGKIFDYVGSYTPAFYLFGSLSSIGICLFYLLYKPVKVDAHIKKRQFFRS